MDIKSYSKSVELNDAIDRSIECAVSTTYTITVPKIIRNIMGIIPGEQVNVGLSIEQQALLISKATRGTTDNIMIVRDNNKLTIPTELRRSLNLNKGDKFKVLTLQDRMAIFRKKTGNLVKRNY
ncbi:hypothetical protein [Evansella cellulosilytica]|uniref:SpoVT-AbrB domain-containing protein n=1 Tax=Evansella cellulosilytica (strain ATCC 21833 / DSM 2522 / FERM P-1141 / JCM 9156 / N-4) TaxID=649639 RepID=E6TYX4_EVAC2|nr:hypothetical protein [Evansella cellulosilytica]ADU31309.1 hypothetical protein Bcell_3064 [Evansella cellulosilytica DSM 2522]